MIDIYFDLNIPAFRRAKYTWRIPYAYYFITQAQPLNIKSVDNIQLHILHGYVIYRAFSKS